MLICEGISSFSIYFAKSIIINLIPSSRESYESFFVASVLARCQIISDPRNLPGQDLKNGRLRVNFKVEGTYRKLNQKES